MHSRVDRLRKACAGTDAVLLTGRVNIAYLSGFTGEDTQFDESAGALIIGHDALILATDSRYETQAKNEASGYEIANLIISNNDLPDAVFCANDQMAIGFLNAISENNLKAPDDIAIIGFDDIQIAKFLQPALSTIGASRFYWGSLAAKQLIDFLDHEQPFQSVRIPTRLIQRASSTKHPIKQQIHL